MVKTKGAAAATKNWTDAIGRVPAKYQAGVNAATGVIQASIDAEQLYAQKIQESIANQSRVKGLQRVTDSDWKNAASSKGAQRIGPGMQASTGRFQTGISEVISVIEGVNLPARTADPMQNVTNRVGALAVALNNHFKK